MNHERFIHRQRTRRKHRVRRRIRGTAERPRLSVARSHKHMSCQLIDDASGRTLLSTSTRDKDMREQISRGGNKEAAATVGRRLAEKAAEAGIRAVAFDRGPYQYHGRVAALADAVRAGGIEF
jgi:large subunit ribosomal protein L18